MKYTHTLLFILLSLSFYSFGQKDDVSWILGSDKTYSQQVHADLQSRTDIPEKVQKQLERLSSSSVFRDGQAYNALSFLYAYMPQSDLVDYDFDFFRAQVDIAFEALNTFSWGNHIPADIFRHFVLVYRVNNENLDTARSFIFHQLKERIKNKSMYEAALEVNHWCHEYVEYQPSDARTSSPLATLRTSHGRCGEESTLTVTALRAVGIPARQCYTPRWAHCDDNHAWVEVWVDGKWYFLGACEPDPELNMGWFAVPSSRTMMVHTNVFGKYNGPEEVNKQTQYYSCINVLSNYAETINLTVTVLDAANRPVKDATVRFKLYNYAEYYTLASRQTDDNGQTSILTGKGDLLVWVNKGNRFQFAKVDGRINNKLTIILDETPISGDAAPELAERTIMLDMCPPTGGATLATTTNERQQENDRRKQQEDTQRDKYRATWPTKASLIKAQCHNANLTDEELFDIIRRSEGNYHEIMKFLDMHNVIDEHYLIREYISALSDKDLRDATADVLEEELSYYHADQWPREVFIKGVLPARISNEMLRPNRIALGTQLKSIFHTRPTIEQLRQYVLQNITVDPQCNYYNCPISPRGVLEGKRADTHSLGIFFVSLCRTFGVPAYMDNANGELYAWENEQWNNVQLSAQNESAIDANATIVLHNPEKYTYYIHYTLQRLENGEYVSYDFENDPRVENDPIRLDVPAGNYCLSTGSRYSNGDVLSQLTFFTVNEHQTIEKNITLRPLEARTNNFGRIDVDQTIVNGQSLQSRMSKNGVNRIILCLVTPGTEPVNHLLKEMEAEQKEYEDWGGPVLFITNNNSWKENNKLPKNIEVTQDRYDQTLQTVLNGLVEKHHGHNPVCLVVDQNGTILFFSEGYHIGLGELLLK